jgi:hypothetical protein
MGIKTAVGMLLALLGTACTGSSPTAPSLASPATPGGGNAAVESVSQVQGRGQTSTGQKVTLYYFSRDVFVRGNDHIVGLPVYVSGDEDDPHPYSAILFTDKQGSVTFTIPANDDSLVARTYNFNGYCGSTNELELPLYQRTAFINLAFDADGCQGTGSSE